MGIFSTIITQPLGYIIKFIYEICGQNYGVAIILFTVLVRLIMLPLSIKQQKSMAKTQKIQPFLNELQRKYKNDKEKLNKEMVKLYQDNNINPMGGCLPLLIQLPILFGIIQVVYKPVTYILKMDVSQLSKGIAEFANMTDTVKEIAVAKYHNLINFDFFGIDLSVMPKDDFGNIIVWIIPLLATLVTYLSGKVTQSMTASKGSSPQNEQAQQMSSSMTTIMPIMTLFFTYTMPIAAALYWFISSAVQTVQQVLLNKFVKVDDIIVEAPKKKDKKKK